MPERPLDPEEREELQSLIMEGLEALGGHRTIGDFFPKDCDDVHEVVGCIRRFIDAFRERGNPSDAERFAYSLGALWGDNVRKALGWKCAMVDGVRGTELAAVISPDGASRIKAQLFIYRLLSQRESENTAGLLFKQLEDGNIPPGDIG